MSEASSSSDWTTQAIDTLQSVIDAIKSKTSNPLLKIARALIYALLALGLVITFLLMVTIGFVRLADGYLPGQVWAVYLPLGGIFFLAGLLAWTKRAKRS